MSLEKPCQGRRVADGQAGAVAESELLYFESKQSLNE